MDKTLFVTLIGLAFGVAIAAWFVAMPWLVTAERRRQRQKIQSGTIGCFDELFHPEAYQANIIWQAETELPAPAPLPGDKAFPDGKIVLRLTPART
ncbi:MAG: hypothetical protein ABI400_06450 [Lacisediminihabitans sp.]